MVIDIHRNGTAAVTLPVNTVDIALDELGYPGWVVTMRTNPRSSVYDDLLSVDDMERWWSAFGKIVQSWNFADEDGHAFPLPRECSTERDLDLPVGVIGFIYRRYIEEFRERIGLPKVPDASSEGTFGTSVAPQASD